MKKLRLLCLVITVLLCLVSCGGGSSPSSAEQSGEKNTKEAETKAEVKPEEIVFTAQNTIDGVAAFTVKRAVVSQTIAPPMPDGYYTTYQADAGKMYLALILDVKNLSSSPVKAAEILNVAIGPEGNAGEYTVNSALLKKDNSDFERAGLYAIDALDTQTVYYLAMIPESAAGATFSLTVKAGEKTFAGIFTASALANRKTISVGQTVSNNDMSVTLERVYYSSTLYPSRPDGYYHYYEAASGKTYLIVKIRVKNLKGTDLGYSSVAGVKCTYNDKYNYSAFSAIEEDGGADLDTYLSLKSIAPLDSDAIFYLMEVPSDAASGKVVVEIFTAGETYYYSM